MQHGGRSRNVHDVHIHDSAQFHSHACREKCLRSDGPAAEGMAGVTDDTKDPTTGRAAELSDAAEPEDSPPSPNRCWMEWSWKHGSDSRTLAARDVLGDRRKQISMSAICFVRWTVSEHRQGSVRVGRHSIGPC